MSQYICYVITCHSNMTGATPTLAAEPVMPTNIGAPIFVAKIEPAIYSSTEYIQY